MNIALFIPFLCMGKGGAERSGIKLAHEMKNRGHECTLFCTGNRLGMPAYPLPENIKWYDLQLKDSKSIYDAQQLLTNLHIDVFCCFNSTRIGLWIPILCKSANIPLLWAERTAPQAVEKYLWNRKERLACMAAADGIVLQCSNYAASLPDFFHKKIFIIPNPAPEPHLIDWAKKNSQRKIILAVARLQTMKQLVTLIKAFAFLQHEFTDWDCYICGDGPLKKDYQSLIDVLGLTARVRLIGAVDNIGDYYAAAQVFCLPSSFEGFPNALIEAQSYGVPAVGFADCAGVNEIIRHGENGMLVARRGAKPLADTLRVLLRDETLRRQMGLKAQVMLSRYEEKFIFKSWENTFYIIKKYRSSTILANIEKIQDDTIKNDLREILKYPPSSSKAKNSKIANIIFAELREKRQLAEEIGNFKKYQVRD